MFGDARRAVIVGGFVLFAAGVLVGYLLGRSGGEPSLFAAPATPSPSSVASTVPGTSLPPAVVTPTPGQAPAISNQAQILREGARPVVTAASAAPCQALVTPGLLGECGAVPVAGGQVVWVVQRSTTPTGAAALEVRVFTYVPDAGGWVEWLQTADPTGERWTEVNVLAVDLTADGVPELLVGYRGIGDLATLEYDIVSYGQDRLPLVLAHPEPSDHGVVVVSAGGIQEYAAQYPGGEPACCPTAYLRRAIAFEEGFFRVVGSETVAPNAVPVSQL